MADGLRKLVKSHKARQKAEQGVVTEASRRLLARLGSGGNREKRAGVKQSPVPAPVVVDRPDVDIEKVADDSVPIEAAAPIEPSESASEWSDSISLIYGDPEEGVLGQKFAGRGDVGIYQSNRPHPIELFKKLSSDFNRLEWTVWEPEALSAEIEAVSGSRPSEVVRNMIGALSALVESEAFWREHHVFLFTCQALNAQITDFSVLPDLTPAEIAFAVGVANEVRDGDDLDLPNGERISGVRFDDQVIATIAAVFHGYGLVYAPEPFERVNEYLRRLQDESGRALADEVKAAWDSMGAGAPEELDASSLGLQIARLYDITEYVRDPFAD